MMLEKEKGEMTMEKLREGIRAAAIVARYEKEFGPMPHPLRIFKFRRWKREFEVFQKGVEFGEKMTRDFQQGVDFGEKLMRDSMPLVPCKIREVRIDD